MTEARLQGRHSQSASFHQPPPTPTGCRSDAQGRVSGSAGLSSSGPVEMTQFGNVYGHPSWTGNFAGGARDAILFYSPPDERWWIGTLEGGSSMGGGALVWTEVARRTIGRTWQGRFTQAERDELLMYREDDSSWWIARWSGGTFEWLDAGHTADTLGSLFFDFRPLFPLRMLGWSGNFMNDPSGRDSFLFYNPLSADWTIGSWNVTTLAWRSAGNTSRFGTNLEPDHRFWTGRFSQAIGDEILFHYGGDANWWLGRWDGATLQWALVANTGDTFGSIDGDVPFVVGRFNHDASNREAVVFYHWPDGNWWLGAWNDGAIQWENVANTGTTFWPTLATRPHFWSATGGKYIVGFDGISEWHRTGLGGPFVWTHIGSSGAFGNIGDGRPLLILDMLGEGTPQVLFYFKGDGNWWLGRELLTQLVWGIVSNTGAIPEDRGIWGSIGSFVSSAINGVYDAAVTALSPALTVIGYIETIPVLGTAVAWSLATLSGIISLSLAVFDAFLVSVGIYLPKRLRIKILVQRFSDMRPVVPAENCEYANMNVNISTEANLTDAINYAATVFKSEANVTLIPEDGAFVRILDEPSTRDTLYVCSDACGWAEDIWGSGGKFRLMMMTASVVANGRRVLGFGSAVVVFAVRKFTDDPKTKGAGLGPLQDYTAVDFCSGDSTMAHEIGHACNLFHEAGTLMQRDDDTLHKNPRPSNLRKYQVMLLRASRHVTFF